MGKSLKKVENIINVVSGINKQLKKGKINENYI